MTSEASNYILIHIDERIIVVNKPNDLLVHHSHYARNIREKSLTQQLREDYQEIFPVHRLDRKTSGILVFARDKEAAKYLQDQFENHQIFKNYVALVRGFAPDKLTIDSPIKDDSGKYKGALTLLSCMQRTEVDIPVEPYPTSRYSLVSLVPQSGRMHQLRKHMNKISHPIIGDPKYGNRHHNHMFEEKFGHSRLYLHTHTIGFKHPETEETVIYFADYPGFWSKDLKDLGFMIDDLGFMRDDL